MAFQVRCVEGTTIVIIEHPKLAAAFRAAGYFWEEVEDQSAREALLSELVDVVELFSQRILLSEVT